MPDSSVKTFRDLIWYQYAKIIAKRALGPEAKKNHYGFIKKTLMDLRNGKKSWSDITREDWQLVESDKACAYCGKTDDLAHEHIVPQSLTINERCATCDTIQSIHNQIWTCKKCNSEKGTLGLYTFYSKRLPNEKKFFDHIPPLIEKKYLKTIYECLDKCTGCLNSTIDNGKQPTVLDLDNILQISGHLQDPTISAGYAGRQETLSFPNKKGGGDV